MYKIVYIYVNSEIKNFSTTEKFNFHYSVLLSVTIC